jgi:hypothetical protein
MIAFMTVAFRKQRQASLPDISFGPYRFVILALPWLILAAAMRVIAFGGGGVALPAIIIANLAVIHAVLVAAQRCIEMTGGQSSLGELGIAEQFKLSLAIACRIALLMIAAAAALAAAGYGSLAPHMLAGIDGMAFDQFTVIGKFWSAAVGAVTLLMVVGAEQNGGRVAFFEAAGELARRWFWLGAAVIALGVVNLGLSFGQGLVRSAIVVFWQTSTSSQFVKNLVYFVFIFSFAMLRLWATLLILTYGLKQSYVHD